MRNKVRKSLAFLLALALVVSVMSGLGLSVSADEGETPVPVVEEQEQPQEDKQETPAEEPAEEEEPAAEPAGEGSGEAQEGQSDTQEPDGETKEENQDDQVGQEPTTTTGNLTAPQAATGDAVAPVADTTGSSVSEYEITCGEQKLTVKLVDTDGKTLSGTAPNDLSITQNKTVSVETYAATVEGYTYYNAKYTTESDNVRYISYLGYFNNYSSFWSWDSYTGWYAVVNGYSKIKDNTITLVYKQDPTSKTTKFTVHYVDENGKEIANKKEEDVGDADTLTFEDYADKIENYTYWRACYGSANNAEVTKVVITTRQNNGNGRPGSTSTTSYSYTFYNDSKKLTTGTEGIDTLSDIYLVYVKDGGGPTAGGGSTGETPTLDEPTHTKQAIKQADGTYDLSLSVSANIAEKETKKKVDIIYVLDVSGSMTQSRMNNQTLLKVATSAIETMNDSLVAEDSHIDPQFALVTFAESSDVKKFNNSNWTSDTKTFSRQLPSNANGGTNYQAGLTNAKSVLASARADATTVVVFLSDGEPTFYTKDNDGTVGGSGSSDNDGRAMSKARGIVKTMTPNYLYTVGVGDSKNYSNLSLVTGAAHEGVKTENFVGDSEDKLKKAFDTIKGDLITLACESVTISDKLSENVTMVMNGESPKSLTGKVTDKDGTEVGTSTTDGGISLNKTDLNEVISLPAPTYENGVISWAFPDGYKLEKDWTYTVTANVQVTEKAYENYRKNSNNYPDTADADTGTHASSEGLYSNVNDNATLTYKVTGQGDVQTVQYPKPVVQITPNKLTITKTVTGLNEAALNTLKNQLTFKVTYTYKQMAEDAENCTETKTVYLKDFTKNSDGTYTYVDENVYSTDVVISVEESNFDLNDYNRTDSSSSTTMNAAINGKRDAAVSFTNNYQHKEVEVTVIKKVIGNMSQDSDTFTFTVSAPTDLNNNDQSFTLSASQTGGKTISIPYGSDFTISETEENGYTLDKIEVDGEEVTPSDNGYTINNVTADTTITFTNDKTINPPSGVTRTIAPFVIMAVLAAGAGVYFVYSRRQRD